MTKRLTITELEQIRQRAEAATEADWIAETEHEGIFVFSEDIDEIIAGPFEFMQDAVFIANARQDVPRLLTEVETLITEKARARRMLDELIGEMANADGAGYALAAETIRADLEKIRKELIDHGE
ncbi:hypothetical protein AB1K91_17650 [Terribacillus sp. 179-K 1B1 HS]|uniref:hypothetical protein n=1 Tax=Terribacillus sp. 179-K 1B1 HS TaxID=3142388 RepID=UPI0039A14267